jgi:ABC-type phosphate transport system substrate-binding protein
MHQPPWALLAMILLCAVPPAAPAVDVLVNAGEPEQEITRSKLRGIFGMRLRAWPDGMPVRVFVLDDNDSLHQEFSKAVLQIYPYQLRQNWDRLLYSGTGQPPVLVGSEAEMLKRVSETPGAIGYVREYRAPVAAPRPAAPNGKKDSSPVPPEEPAPPAPVKVLHVH